MGLRIKHSRIAAPEPPRYIPSIGNLTRQKTEVRE